MADEPEALAIEDEVRHPQTAVADRDFVRIELAAAHVGHPARAGGGDDLLPGVDEVVERRFDRLHSFGR